MLFVQNLLFLIIPIILFAFGTAIGSFLNVVIYRTINEESWVKGRSKCEFCKKKIAWYDNIPLLSFVVLDGRCRHCKKKIASIHPIVELLTGSLFLWWYMIGFIFFRLTQEPLNVVQPLFWLLVGVIFIVIFITDLRYYIIPDYSVVFLLILILLYRMFLIHSGIMQGRDFFTALLSTIVLTGFFFLLWFFSKGKGFGFGDVKLAIPLGLLLGWPKILVGVFFAFIFGAFTGIILIMFGKRKWGQKIPFGPFLILGAVVALIYGQEILVWYFGKLL